VLLDAAYDASPRDLRANWIPVAALALAAVAVTTIGVAVIARHLVPGMSWAVAIALGAIVSPPDAAAASAVLRQLRLPHRLLVILEGESLFNDASALLVYRLAVGAVIVNGFSASRVLSISVLTVPGSLILGYALARVYLPLVRRLSTIAAGSTVLQFASTFCVWILADHLGLSPILTIVTYAITLARRAPAVTPAWIRVPSYAVWDVAVFVLNVLAFMLIGLQVRPILLSLAPAQRFDYAYFAALVFATVIVTRFAWVFGYYAVAQLGVHWRGAARLRRAAPSIRTAILVSWCGMRGIVTLAAALALPKTAAYEFPHRERILVTAFVVVIGTLILQGFSLRPLLRILNLRDDGVVDGEVHAARLKALEAVLKSLADESSPAADALRAEYTAALQQIRHGTEEPVVAGAATAERGALDTLRSRALVIQRRTLLELRSNGRIGDDAFHRMEEELDWHEIALAQDAAAAGGARG
jgi:CPA1 family monovalent cation:H+ antiporter